MALPDTHTGSLWFLYRQFKLVSSVRPSSPSSLPRSTVICGKLPEQFFNLTPLYSHALNTSHPINYSLPLDPFALSGYYGSKGLNKRTLSSFGKLFRESTWNLVSLYKVCADGPGNVRCDADVFIRAGRCIVSSCTI